MEFLQFYYLVLREAFRHSLNITQAIVFVAMALGGFVVARNPSMKPLIDSFDLNGWRIAVLVFALIVATRLLLAPYWLWRGMNGRIISSPQEAIDFGFQLSGFRTLRDQKKKAVQIGFQLTNSLNVPIQYKVEDVYVEVNGSEHENPSFSNMGGTIARNTSITFDYDWIFGVAVPNHENIVGHASITYRYGVAGRSLSRQARYVSTLWIDRTLTRHKHTEEAGDKRVTSIPYASVPPFRFETLKRA